jgi:25S rRNA (uracil2843-N3)-methyltransferase
MAPQKRQPAKANTKAKSGQRKGPIVPREPRALISLELQQHLLNIFKGAFATRLESDIQPLLQEVKGHLFNRDFAIAFGRDDYLEAYAARWSPSRALGYLDVLTQLEEITDALGPSSRGHGKVICLGGGAGAEIVAFGGFLKFLQRTTTGEDDQKDLEVVAVDIADWTTVITQLQENITAPPKLPKFASAAAQAANVALLDPEDLTVTFQQSDLLNADLSTLEALLQGATLVTIMFTLNELYSVSLPPNPKVPPQSYRLRACWDTSSSSG